MVVIITVIAVITAVFQSAFLRCYTDKRADGKGAFQYSVFYAGWIGFVTLALNGFRYNPSSITVVLGLINCAVFALYSIGMVKSMNLGPYTFLMVCMLSGGILVPFLYDSIALRTPISLYRFAGIAIMLASFAVMNPEGFREKKSGKFLFWCAMLFIANGFYGVLMNTQQRLANYTQRSEMIITTYLGMALISFIIETAVNRKNFLADYRMPKIAWLFMFLSATCATVAQNTTLMIMKYFDITQVSVITNGGVLAGSGLLAFTLFREKFRVRVLIGMLMAGTAIVLLSI